MEYDRQSNEYFLAVEVLRKSVVRMSKDREALRREVNAKLAAYKKVSRSVSC